MPISGLSFSMPFQPASNKKTQTKFPQTSQSVDTFKKSNSTSPPLFKGNEQQAAASSFTYPAEENLVNHLSRLGAADAPTSKRPAFTVSRQFSPDGKEHEYTYGDLLKDSQKMAAAYKKQGLAGKSIAVADTNTFDFLNAYYGGLAASATMVPLNMLALQDENTKAGLLSQMIAAPRCEGFVFGKDPMFREMEAGFQKILKLKKSPLTKTATQRYLQNMPPRHNGLDQLTYKQLDTIMERKLEAAGAKLEAQKGMPLSEQDKKAMQLKIKADFKTLYDALPAQLKLITPEAKAKLMTGKPSPIDALKRNPSPEQMAEVIFTPGISENPKGVELTHKNMVFRSQSLSKALEDLIGPEDKILLGLPLFHISGRIFMLVGMKHQTPIVMLPSLGAAVKDKQGMDNVLKTIEEKHITVLPSVPLLLEKLVAHANQTEQGRQALKNVRVIVCGGAPLQKSTYETLKRINPEIKILEAYGSSESSLNSFNRSNVPGLVGTPMPGVEMKLVDANGKETLEGPGEVMVKSPGVGAQYVEGTVSSGKSRTIADENGFFRTGDLARRVLPQGVSEPQLQIIGRGSKLMKGTNGQLHAPEAFEAALKGADNRVTDAMAVAYKPHSGTEKSVIFAVTPDATVNEADLKQAMRKQAEAGKASKALLPDHIVVLSRNTLPEAFRNDFKREAGYKAATGFANQLVNKGLVQFQDKTKIVDNAALQQFANDYRYQG